MIGRGEKICIGSAALPPVAAGDGASAVAPSQPSDGLWCMHQKVIDAHFNLNPARRAHFSTLTNRKLSMDFAI